MVERIVDIDEAIGPIPIPPTNINNTGSPLGMLPLKTPEGTHQYNKYLSGGVFLTCSMVLTFQSLLYGRKVCNNTITVSSLQ